MSKVHASIDVYSGRQIARMTSRVIEMATAAAITINNHCQTLKPTLTREFPSAPRATGAFGSRVSASGLVAGSVNVSSHSFAWVSKALPWVSCHGSPTVRPLLASGSIRSVRPAPLREWRVDGSTTDFMRIGLDRGADF